MAFQITAINENSLYRRSWQGASMVGNLMQIKFGGKLKFGSQEVAISILVLFGVLLFCFVL